MQINTIPCPPPVVGSSIVITLRLLIALTAHLCLGQLVGWNATWRTFGVTPLEPHFFDMHVTVDYTACAAKGIDPYVPHACSPANFNVPPIWLWLSFLGVSDSDVPSISVGMIFVALCVQGRSAVDGVLGLAAILSPSVMMGFERANPDLLLFALVGSAALIYNEQRFIRIWSTLGLLCFGIALKLFPMFCIALISRFRRRTLLFAVVISVFSLIYLLTIFKYVLLIGTNVPTTFMLSYGYKALFLGLDHLRDEAGLKPFGLADTWLPVAAGVLTLVFAGATALTYHRTGRTVCTIADTVSGTAFTFGSGIYCGTFLLGTNFIYRLTFLLLCLSHLQDSARTENHDRARSPLIERTLLVLAISVLWLNGDANGHTTFLLMPQLLNWLLFFGLATVLMSNFLSTSRSSWSDLRHIGGS